MTLYTKQNVTYQQKVCFFYFLIIQPQICFSLFKWWASFSTYNIPIAFSISLLFDQLILLFLKSLFLGYKCNTVYSNGGYKYKMLASYRIIHQVICWSRNWDEKPKSETTIAESPREQLVYTNPYIWWNWEVSRGEFKILYYSN